MTSDRWAGEAALLRELLATGLIRIVSYSPDYTSNAAREALVKALAPRE